MTHDDAAQELCADTFADPDSGGSGVVGNDSEVMLLPSNNFVDQRSGVPPPMNLPIIRAAPSGIWVTASSREMVFMVNSHCGPATINGNRADLALRFAHAVPVLN